MSGAEERQAPFTLAVVGAGPSCTYVLERLAATIGRLGANELALHVFDRSGQFGAGQVHSTEQPATSYLNRIVGQVAFAADESVEGAGELLDADARPTLHDWCRRRFRETGDPAFDLAPEDWPKRYLHGLALRESFDRYVEIFRAQANVTVHLHHAEVVDIVEAADGGLDVVSDQPAGPVHADRVLLLTGHSSNDPARSPRLRPLVEFAERHEATHVASAYPLEKTLPPASVGPGTVVGCAGMGLTAIDVILFLTEGTGGTFAPDGEGRLRYLPSGREPASIVPFSDAGLFTFARPFNAKERDLERLEHRGRFLTETAIDLLRTAAGVPIEIGRIGTRRQLDFERDLLPLTLLEMAYVYYRTLLGQGFADHLARRVRVAYQAFLAGSADARSRAEDSAALAAAVEAAVDEAQIDEVLAGRRSAEALGDPGVPTWASAALARYREIVAPEDGPLRENRFSWPATIEPIADDDCRSPERYRAALLAFMERDHRRAAQGNVDDPAKAAADGVWRDLRPVLAYAVDFGGLTASSHELFLGRYMRHHNRLANGAALEVMQRIVALVEQGFVDPSIGPRPSVELDETLGRFRVVGTATGADVTLDMLVDARVHPFDPENDVMALYANLLRRGLIRKWRNPAAAGRDYEPGGLDLTRDFHPVRADGAVDARLTFLGPPSEGVMFFQLGALRPSQNHHVMQDILCWLNEFWRSVEDDGARGHVPTTAR